MASPYTGQFGGANEGLEKVKEYTSELEGLRTKVESGEIPQSQYVTRAQELIPILQKEDYALRRISSNFNAKYGSTAKTLEGELKNANVYQSARELLGRDVSKNEVAQFLPRFGTGSPEDVQMGRGYLAEVAAQEAKSPKALQGKAGQYSGDVNAIFNDLVKRGATQEEINHFGSQLASGDIDAYTLRQFIGQLPEVQEREDSANRQALSQELSGYDQDFFNRSKEDVISRYAKAGIQNSPSLDFALTNLMGDIQKERSAYLAGLSRDDYANRRGTARQDYAANMDRYLGERDYSRNRSDAYGDLLTNRSFGSIDYRRQQDDLMRLLSQQGGERRSSGLGGLIGGIGGATIGGFTGGPAGAGAGYQIGSGTGMYFD